MLKTVHVHNDLKFVGSTDSFDSTYFDNTVVIIDAPETYSGPYRDQAIFLSSSRQDQYEVVKICSEAALVVLYDLDVVKSQIAVRLSQKVAVAWRFFGYELYNRRIRSYLSETSLTYYRGNKVRMGMLKRLRGYFPQLKSMIANGSSINRLFLDAVRRTDLFLGLSSYEYEHLAMHWSLPRFLQLPMMWASNPGRSVLSKSNVVLVGNNRSVYNNHLDIIDLICRSHCDTQLSFLFPFSYGPENRYTSEVRHRAEDALGKVRFLEDFLPRMTYLELITTARAAVFNSYRQMAMGNIFVLLEYGVKIYLNTRNIIYHWLIDLGLKVYTIEDFASDMKSAAALELNPEEKVANAKTLEELKCRFGKEQFANAMLALVEGDV